MKFKKIICILLTALTVLMLASCGYNPEKEDLDKYITLGSLDNLTYDLFYQRYQNYRNENAHTHGGFTVGYGDTLDMYITCEIVNNEGEMPVYEVYPEWTFTNENPLNGYDIGVKDENRKFDKCLIFSLNKSSDVSNVKRTIQLGTAFSFTYDIGENAPQAVAGKTVRFTILVTKIVPTGKFNSLNEASDYGDPSIKDYLIELFNKRTPDKDTVEDGDWVVIDYEGKLSGTGAAYNGNRAEDDSLRVGDGYLWSVFEKELVGRKTGEEFTVTISVPSTNPNKEIAGKDVEYTVKIDKIYDTAKAAKEYGYSSIVELMNDLRVYLYAQATIMDLINERSTRIGLPPKMYEQYRKISSNYVNTQIDEFIEYYEKTYYTSYTREQAFQYIFSAMGIDLYINTLTENDCFNVLVAYQTKKALGFEYTEEDYKKDLIEQALIEGLNDGVTYTEKEIENIYTKERLKGYFIQAKCAEILFERVTGFKYVPDTK